MIDFLAYIYDVEDINDLDWDEEEKLVDLNWPVRSGFKRKPRQMAGRSRGVVPTRSSRGSSLATGRSTNMTGSTKSAESLC